MNHKASHKIIVSYR